MLLLVLVIVMITGCTIKIGYDHYIYTDTQNNEGIAKDCWSRYGVMKCELEDGSIVQVIKYKGE